MTVHELVASAVAEAQKSTGDPDTIASHVLEALDGHHIALVPQGEQVGVVRIGFPDGT